jgi:prolyl oligopeptidase
MLDDDRRPEPAWDVLLDLDALAREEAEDWVWAGCSTLPPDYRRGLVQLSRGGADAVTLREFDLDAKRFIADGFALPEAKTQVDWLDQDRLIVATPLGGDTFATQSGYARTVRLWRRGTPFVEAPIVYEAERAHIYAFGSRATEVEKPRIFRACWISSAEVAARGRRRTRLDVPTDYPLGVATR